MPPMPETSEFGFVEVTGAYGFQFGTTAYLPDGSATSYKHPLVNGFAIGGTLGYAVAPRLYLVANYEFTSAKSVTGSIPNAADEIQGSVSYQTVVVGVRPARDMGPGRLYGEFAVGIALPFETELRYKYASALSAAGISGEGTKTDEYGLGIGAHGIIGYDYLIGDRISIGLALKVKSFVSNNNGKQTHLKNFVTNFAAKPAPTATTADISYDTDISSGTKSSPTTYSVQDLRLQLGVAFRF